MAPAVELVNAALALAHQTISKNIFHPLVLKRKYDE
jgi:hypothetical protein